MDFIVGLPRTQSGFDSIWVIVDRLSKVAHFIPVKERYMGQDLAELFMSRIICMHGYLRESYLIEEHSSPQDFGRSYMKRWVLSSISVQHTIHKQMGRQNGYQASLIKAPFEVLYGRRCRTPLLWDQVSEKVVFGPDMVKEAERQVQEVRNNLKVAQSRQKSYADHRRQELIFEIGDHIYLKVSPIRGLRRFKVKGKLTPIYIGPFRIVDKKEAVAYQLELPTHLSGTRCLPCVTVKEMFESTRRTDSFGRIKILEVSERVTRNKKIRMCKVQRKHRTEAEATWEREDDLKTEYPHLFFLLKSRGRDLA
ncbi:hypothetical protein U9M48_019866 [Paspalum notatum var. saurae]|uniref:Tf2-1-like SH3-like domain-containing protein n=1 Tax=Paspalum notatum var. saurae TaxID=547442 RepID=A0AAQ3TFR3_PASNO